VVLVIFLFFLPLPFRRLGEITIEDANNRAEIITIDAPIGKSDINESQNPIRQLIIPIIGEKIRIFLKS
jgi:hypothetical protein